jgi:hypothetical protein
MAMARRGQAASRHGRGSRKPSTGTCIGRAGLELADELAAETFALASEQAWAAVRVQRPVRIVTRYLMFEYLPRSATNLAPTDIRHSTQARPQSRRFRP